MSRRDGAIVAWHEVPGTAPPQKSRPVGYGVIRAGGRVSQQHLVKQSSLGLEPQAAYRLHLGEEAWGVWRFD